MVDLIRDLHKGTRSRVQYAGRLFPIKSQARLYIHTCIFLSRQGCYHGTCCRCSWVTTWQHSILLTDLDHADDVAVLADNEGKEAEKLGLRVSWVKITVQNFGYSAPASPVHININVARYSVRTWTSSCSQWM